METATVTEEALIAAHIHPHPWRHSSSWAVVGERGVPVWAILSRYDPAHDDVAVIAHEYGVPPAAIEAALAYYRRHRAGIDRIIASNRGE